MVRKDYRAAGIVDLAALRESRGISLRHISRVTQIGLRYLEAIERAEFQKLPGGVYDISYIRQYACEIGLDPTVVLDFYRSQMPAGGPPEEPPRQSAWGGFLALLWKHRRAA